MCVGADLTGRIDDLCWVGGGFFRCLSPPSSGFGATYHVVVSVGGSPTVYSRAVWVYDPPVIDAVSPHLLRPNPDATLVVTGVNFGSVPGVVSVADHTAACLSWTNERLECVAPRGVSASAVVRVTAASGQTSAVTAESSVQYR